MRKKNLSTRSGEQNTAVCILLRDPVFEDRANRLSVRLGLPVCRDPKAVGETFGLALVPDADGLSLFDGKMTLRGDFTHMQSRLLPGKLPAELLVRAAKLRDPGPCPVAIDCTAGLGDDSLLLAAMGYTVHLFEYDPITAELLDSALRKSQSSDSSGALSDITNRMILHREDSLAGLSAFRELPVRSKEEETTSGQDPDSGAFPYITYAPDLIYLDPMFPARRKSGLITKKLQMLQMLENPCADESALLAAAVRANPRRIVIKRPLKGPFLAGIRPAYSIKGKAIRYDCIVVRG
jgi:16S rRNA (guanine1516-N2)-methyltransferase